MTRSAFGGIVATNQVIDSATVQAIEGAAQADLIIAPGYEDGVIERIRSKRKHRALEGLALPKRERAPPNNRRMAR